MKTIVYVDGFNLYYGCLKGTPYRWLDLQTFAQKMLPKDQIVGINYFTAKVSARLGKIDAPQDQASYFRALRTLPNLSIFFGRFLTSETWAYRVHPPRVAKEKVKVYRTEEKGSDVNLATNLLVDGYQEAYDLAVVVSNDGDLKAPVEYVRTGTSRRLSIRAKRAPQAGRRSQPAQESKPRAVAHDPSAGVVLQAHSSGASLVPASSRRPSPTRMAASRNPRTGRQRTAF